ncbi:DUF6174 domain-containing protein [Streptomyces sp. 142MFCol3.1]|uniref:DUF6174 domain-containing protein n=1 Tax=Streptomyces sp. 142MFCol3.1 TaxID=1172179 RepID=UPI00041E275B|nr:DUF6174 domain-containing protein [Streptomyces sp. 142MFCol3.1]
MTVHRPRPRTALPVVALTGALVWSTSACGHDAVTSSARQENTVSAWKEPASYSYTLESSEGERSLIGKFRITVRGGKVSKVVGLDDSGRRVVKGMPDEVPTIGALLKQVDQARRDHADTAEVAYAADGHPARISLDLDENAVDDEARYVISAYRLS